MNSYTCISGGVLVGRLLTQRMSVKVNSLMPSWSLKYTKYQSWVDVCKHQYLSLVSDHEPILVVLYLWAEFSGFWLREYQLRSTHSWSLKYSKYQSLVDVSKHQYLSLVSDHEPILMVLYTCTCGQNLATFDTENISYGQFTHAIMVIHFKIY